MPTLRQAQVPNEEKETALAKLTRPHAHTTLQYDCSVTDHIGVLRARGPVAQPQDAPLQRRRRRISSTMHSGVEIWGQKRPKIIL